METIITIVVALTGVSAIGFGFLAIVKWEAYCKFTDRVVEILRKF